MKKTFFLPALFLVLLVISCNKKDSTMSKTQLLTSGSWRLTAVVADEDGNGTYETDDFASFPDCFKDNYYTFFPMVRRS